MAYTAYGEFMRILRIRKHEVMGDLAEVLHTNTPFISAVENGKKNVPESWIGIIVDHYDLSDEDEQKLKEAILNSKTQAKIELATSTASKREVALKFARSFGDMDDETAKKIITILNGGES